MTPVTTFAEHTVALFGLGGSGLATALALKAGGARVIACDDSAEAMAKAEGQGVETGDLRVADWSRFAALILSPGVPLTHPEPHWSVRLAQGAGVEVIGDIELFCRERQKIAPSTIRFKGATIIDGRTPSPLPFVAITGTNGKSTTTALVAHILREAGRDVQMGGNIGTAILSLQPPAPDRFHVVEMSSFQIDLTPSLKPTVGVLLNLSPDHLDRHGSMESYVAIKERLVMAAEQAVIGFDDDHCRGICGRLLRQDRPVFPVSQENSLAGAVFYENGFLCRVVRTVQPRWVGERLLDLRGVSSLRGAHNGQNAAAAFSVCEALDVSHDLIAKALKTFPGLPHRMEEVGRLGRAIFVNDSKATNADSTEKALSSFDRVFWILGGKAKEGGIEPLRPYFPKVERAYLIGEAADAFAATLGDAAPFVRSGTLDQAVAEAAADAARSAADEPVVLLSPACASYDQFRNFEERGNRFRDLVRALPGIEVKGL